MNSKSKLKKIYVILVGAMIVSTNQVCFANNVEHCNKLHYHNECCDTKKNELLFKGAFLYWKGELRGIECAFGNESIVTTGEEGVTLITKTEADTSPSFKWHPGVRLGSTFLFKDFDFDLDWSYFPGRAFYKKDEQHYGDWKLKYNDIDFKIGYKFYPSSRFYVKPFIGLRGTWIRQTLHSYLETPKIDDQETFTLTFNMHNKEKFWWIGPQLGIETNWYIGWNFNLYCTLDVVNYYGHDHANYNRVDHTPEDPDEGNPETNQTNIWTKKAKFNNFALDDSFGIRWDKYICRSEYDVHFNLKLGFEQHRIYEFSNLAGGPGSLSLDGGILEAGLGIRF